MRRTLTRLAPRREEHARVAVLSPGPSNEAYFEHAYLANYLGYTLVQGADLSVRDGALWLRTIGRLERIDAVLRRVDDAWCDPLELREDSLLGVPGLLQAARAGNLTLANALGSGVLEHPGLTAFLPELCRSLLGEDLHLAGLPTWWCGNKKELRWVLEHLDELVIKPVSGPDAGRWLLGSELSADERAALSARMRAEPHRYVAQEPIVPSTSPALIGTRIEPRPTVLRSFLVADEEGYGVLPGGLSRVALSTDTVMVSNQLGGLGKDTWVLASEPERQETLLVSADSLAPAVVRDTEVSSRVADNLFWIGRYAERAEGLVRLLRITIFKLSERASFAREDEAACCVRSLLAALTRQTLTFPGFVGKGAEERLRNPVPEMLSLISDLARLGGLPQTLQALGQAAWSVRDRLSTDTWRVVNDIEGRLRGLTKRPPEELAGALDELDPLITSLVAFSALTQENMTHSEGWHFLEAGRRLERGANLATLLRSTLVPSASDSEETLVVEAVLGVTDSLITYRRRYQGGTRVGALLDLVFQDETNPRALAYQLVQLERLVAEMPRAELASGRTLAEKLVLRALTGVRLTEIDQLVHPAAEDGEREGLEEMLGTLSADLAAISDALTGLYFRHEEQPHNLLRREEGAPA
jgi:uncharacterized alpha-E superfamily protein